MIRSKNNIGNTRNIQREKEKEEKEKEEKEKEEKE